MNKYKVKVTHVFSELLDIEADSPEEAKTKADEILKTPNREAQINYEASAPSENWAVVTEEEFQKIVEDVVRKVQEEENSESEIAK